MCGVSRTKIMFIGAVAGGLLFVASVRPSHVFAMSDSPSAPNSSVNPVGATQGTDATTGQTSTSTGSDSADAQTTDTTPNTTLNNNVPNGGTTGATNQPSQPTNSSVATGSTATQDDTSIVNSNSSTATSGNSGSGSQSGNTSSVPSSDSNSLDPTDTSSTDGGSSTTAQNTNNTKINNNVTGNAQTGDASVSYSQQGGNATTGNASDTATVINSSTSSVSGNGFQSFTYNLNGNQSGNVLLDLSSLLGTANNITPTNSGTVTTDNQNNTTVNNNVNLTAATGNATVANNAAGGNAKTGNALTQADIVNLLSSLVCDGKSFIGTININGNLNGNILIPVSLIDSLLKPSTQPAVAPTAPTAAGTITSTNNTSINNEVSLTAKSGTATEINNGVSGKATSGNANTSLNMYNMINNNIVGGNVLLVFVNVVGHWYGLLMNAPTGATTAALGGGIQQDTVAPVSQATSINNVTINNIVNLCSTTGNAMVSDNGVAGNATTGNATAIADIANVVNSQINLSGWLGVLVINVFGTWNGSLLAQPTATPLVTVHSSHGHHSVLVASGSSSGRGLGYSNYSFYTSPTGGSMTTPPTVTSATQVLGASTTGTSADVVASSVPTAKHIASAIVKKSSIKNLVISLIVVLVSALVIVVSTHKISKNPSVK